MADYKSAYFHLFNAITDGLRMLDAGQDAAAFRILKGAQREAEMLIVFSEEDEEGKAAQ